MDGEKASMLAFRVSIRSLLPVLAALVVLFVPVAWSIRQSRAMQDALTRAIAAEKAATQAQANAEQARDQVQGKPSALRDAALRRAARRDPKEDAERTRQLAEEIDALSRIEDRIQEDLYRIKAKTTPQAPPPNLDALRDPRNRDRELPTEPDAGSP